YDAGIGNALRHHDRPDGEAGERVRQKPVAPVKRKPAEDGKQLPFDGGWGCRRTHDQFVLTVLVRHRSPPTMGSTLAGCFDCCTDLLYCLAPRDILPNAARHELAGKTWEATA